MDRGLVDRFNLYSVGTSDSYGTLEESLTLVKESVKGRLTTEYLDRNETVQRIPGKEWERLLKCILDYTPEIVWGTQWILKKVVNTYETETYNIQFFQHQRNAQGKMHHTSVVVEMQ